jgi:nitric oxide reductase NorE protein
MSTSITGRALPSPDQPARRPRHIPGEEGIWVFIFGDMTVFAILFGTYLYYRAKDVALFTTSQQVLDTTFGLINTLLLLFSSLLVVTAVAAVRRGATRHAPTLLAGAIACGLGFSALKIIEYVSKVDIGITPATNNFYMLYFVLTGLHWFHLILGLGVLTYMYFSARRPALDAKQFGFFEGAGCYWHMVDLLWIVLFPLLYLVN